MNYRRLLGTTIMTDQDEKKFERAFGFKPIANQSEEESWTAEAFIDQINSLLKDDIAGIFKENVSEWRKKNAIRIVKKAQTKFKQHAIKGSERAHPRLVCRILEQGSWSDSYNMHEKWAGLLISSCCADGKDEGNLMFVDFLSRLSRSEGRILDHLCVVTRKYLSKAGWLGANPIQIDIQELRKLTTIDDAYLIDRELDHLKSLGLINGSFKHDSTKAELGPTPMALQMFVRYQGFRGSPVHYFGLTQESDQNLQRYILRTVKV